MRKIAEIAGFGAVPIAATPVQAGMLGL